MSEYDELNRKLAGFAGFRETTIKGMWAFPIGATTSAYTHSSCRFSESLDFCFKWLVPKILVGSRLAGVNVYQDQYHSRAVVNTIEAEYYWADAETPALALCLAVERLLDEEDKGRSKAERKDDTSKEGFAKLYKYQMGR